MQLSLLKDTTEKSKTKLVSAYGEGTNIFFKIDPNIMGGLSLKVGDETLDLSIRGKVKKLINQLNFLGENMSQLNPSEISSVLKEKIAGLDLSAERKNEGIIVKRVRRYCQNPWHGRCHVWRTY